MEEVAKLFGILIAVTGAGTLAYLAVAFAGVLVKRLERPVNSATGLEARVEELQARLDRLEGAEHRMSELEERVDFTERLLAQGREQARIGPGQE